MSRKGRRLTKWVSFSVGFPFVPFLILLGTGALAGQPVAPLDMFILRGTLLVLAVGLAAGAMGELAAGEQKWGGSEIAALVVSFSNALAAMTFYSYVSNAYATGGNIEVNVAVFLSLLCYAVAVATGGWCVILTTSERSEGSS